MDSQAVHPRVSRFFYGEILVRCGSKPSTDAAGKSKGERSKGTARKGTDRKGTDRKGTDRKGTDRKGTDP
jgi:hypothetical protein